MRFSVSFLLIMCVGSFFSHAEAIGPFITAIKSLVSSPIVQNGMKLLTYGSVGGSAIGGTIVASQQTRPKELPAAHPTLDAIQADSNAAKLAFTASVNNLMTTYNGFIALYQDSSATVSSLAQLALDFRKNQEELQGTASATLRSHSEITSTYNGFRTLYQDSSAAVASLTQLVLEASKSQEELRRTASTTLRFHSETLSTIQNSLHASKNDPTVLQSMSDRLREILESSKLSKVMSDNMGTVQRSLEEIEEKCQQDDIWNPAMIVTVILVFMSALLQILFLLVLRKAPLVKVDSSNCTPTCRERNKWLELD